MRQILIISSAAFLSATTAIAQDRTYQLTGFDKIETSAGVEVNVTVGSDFAVIGDAVRGEIDNLEVTLDGDTLNISRDTSAGWTSFSLLGAFAPDDKFVVTVAMPELVALESTSGTDVTVTGATAGLVQITSTSGSALRFVDAKLGDIAIESSSGSDLRLSGTCQSITAEATSGSHLDASDLACASAKLHASSGASLEAFASKTASAQASSGASLRLRGGADITSESVSSGASFRAN